MRAIGCVGLDGGRELKTLPISSAVAGLAAGAVFLGCLLPGQTGTWSLAVGAALLPVALIALGAKTRERSAAGFRVVLAVLTLLVLGTLGALILLHRAGRTGATGLLLLLSGIWLLPLILTGLGHALTYPPTPPRTGAEPRRQPER